MVIWSEKGAVVIPSEILSIIKHEIESELDVAYCGDVIFWYKLMSALDSWLMEISFIEWYKHAAWYEQSWRTKVQGCAAVESLLHVNYKIYNRWRRRPDYHIDTFWIGHDIALFWVYSWKAWSQYVLYKNKKWMIINYSISPKTQNTFLIIFDITNRPWYHLSYAQKVWGGPLNIYCSPIWIWSSQLWATSKHMHYNSLSNTTIIAKDGGGGRATTYVIHGLLLVYTGSVHCLYYPASNMA